MDDETLLTLPSFASKPTGNAFGYLVVMAIFIYAGVLLGIHIA